jgi:Fic family protein
VNHAAAVEFIRKNWMVEKRIDRSISIQDMESLFQILMPDHVGSVSILDLNNLPLNQGLFRRTVIRVRGSPTVRPYPHEIRALIQKAIDLRFQEHAVLHPVVADILFMMNFLFIHPYSDGNGRISRLMFQLMLYSKGYFGCIIPFTEKALFFSHFTPYFEEGHCDGIVSYVSKRIQSFHQELIDYERGKGISF